MSEAAVDSLLALHRDNSRRLDECQGPHDFSVPIQHYSPRWACSKCGGQVDGTARFWYSTGLRHGTKSTP